MAKSKKCGNVPCNCIATDGDYCSAYCAGAEEGIGVACHCGHLECAGDVSEVETPGTELGSTGIPASVV